MPPAWHQHITMYQDLDSKWVHEERRINEQDDHNRKLAAAMAKVKASKIESDASIVRSHLLASQMAYTDQVVKQTQAHRQALFEKNPALAQRRRHAQSLQARSSEPAPLRDDMKGAMPGTQQIVILSDSDEEPPEQKAAPPRQDDGDAVDLISSSSAASEFSEEEEDDSPFPKTTSLILDLPKRWAMLRNLALSRVQAACSPVHVQRNSACAIATCGLMDVAPEVLICVQM
jgi:hypothetical protein